MLTFNLDWIQVLGLVVSIILPIFVALITNSLMDAKWKAVILAALSALTGFGTELLKALTDHVQYNVGQGLLSAFAAFLIATAMYFGLWKPTGLTSSGNGLLSGNRTVTVQESPETAQRRVTFQPGSMNVQDSYRNTGTPLASKTDPAD